MARGRPKKSATAHALAGNPSKKPLLHEPSAGGANLEPPAGMKASAQEVWRRVVPQLDAWNKLSPVDRELLAGFCALMARHYELETTIAESGCTYVAAKSGLVKERPEVKLSAQSLNAARLIGESFGFTPQARVRLGTTEAPDDEADPLDSL